MGPRTPLSLHPEAGDLLITEDSHHAAPFRVNVVPHPAQIRCRTYDDAWINAQLVAEMNDVDFWYAEDDALRSLCLLGHYRTQPDPQHWRMRSNATPRLSRSAIPRRWSRLPQFARKLRSVHRTLRQARMVARGLTFHRHPILAQIVPIHRCNLSCTYCNEFDAHSQPVPTVDMLARIDRLVALGTTIIDLSRGEPLLHPELDEIIRRIRRHGLLAVPAHERVSVERGADHATQSRRLGSSPDQHRQRHLDDTSKKTLRLLDPKLQLLARHAQFAVNINSVLGGSLQHPQDALTIARRAIELGLTATVGLIHETGGQLIPLTPDRQQVYEEIQRLTARSIQRRTRTRSNTTSRGACRTTGTAAPGHGTSTFARMASCTGARSSGVTRKSRWASTARSISSESPIRTSLARRCAPSRASITSPCWTVRENSHWQRSPSYSPATKNPPGARRRA